MISHSIGTLTCLTLHQVAASEAYFEWTRTYVHERKAFGGQWDVAVKANPSVLLFSCFYIVFIYYFLARHCVNADIFRLPSALFEYF